MNVSAILKQKGRSVATIAATATLFETAQILFAKKIGAIVVSAGDGGVTGIVSERDIVRAIAISGPDILSSTVSTIMTRNVTTCTDNATLDQLMKIMTRGQFRHLPVVDADGKLDGIISIGDVVKYHVGEITMEADAMRDYIASH